MTNTTPGQCGLAKNDTDNKLGLRNTYGGIPQNLIFNSILLGFLILVGTFTRDAKFHYEYTFN